MHTTRAGKTFIVAAITIGIIAVALSFLPYRITISSADAVDKDSTAKRINAEALQIYGESRYIYTVFVFKHGENTCYATPYGVLSCVK